MRARISAMAILGLLLAAAENRVRGDEPHPAVKLELRRAETTPGQNLTEVQLPGYPNPFYVHPQSELTNADVAEAAAGHTDRGDATIELVFTEEGAKKMIKLTREHLLKHLAILIDGQAIAAPRIVSEIRGRAQITGAFDRAGAERIAAGIASATEK